MNNTILLSLAVVFTLVILYNVTQDNYKKSCGCGK